ncbi:VWA domain-containing protein [Actinomadura barringtoniae]|uniref:VWA domain-containing protein n=1 Tax=Actinomadura barringtoniae TaxID=1427535 RepID=A0A939PDX1_9ACTN|nr:vWA domain-containing protein [Actinomadura barringtoniae]MBO2448308.1 VWA domain-containing protein [Actinomadura barringtoniae]
MRHEAGRRRTVLTTAMATAVVAAAIVTGGWSAPRTVPPPSADTSVVTVKTGGDRTGIGAVAPLAGVRLGLYAAEGDTSPVDGTWGVCTSDGDGDCSFTVPDTGGANNGKRFYVKQIAAPAGWYTNPSLRTGPGSGSSSTEQPYVFQTPALQPDTTYHSTKEFMYDTTRGQLTASDGIWQQSRNNPPLPTRCGLDVALVLDLSSSVGSALPNLKKAADKITDGLVGTPSRMALYSFDRGSPSAGTQNHPALSSVSTKAGADAVKARYAGWALGSGTNWDQALWKPAQASQKYELAIVLTDGNPTYYGDLEGSGGTTRISEVENGIFSANALKKKGTRTLALGIGKGATGLTALNLRSISGPTAFGGSNLSAADYFQVDDYEAAGDAIHNLILQQCDTSLSVIKQIVPAGNTGENVSGSENAGAGWTFNATTTTPGVTGVPTSDTTSDDGTGSISFEMNYTGSTTSAGITVGETQHSGHTLVTQGGKNAVCVNLDDGSKVGVTNSGGTAFKVNVPLDAAVSCTIYNRPKKDTPPKPKPPTPKPPKPKPKPRPKPPHGGPVCRTAHANSACAYLPL